MDEEIEDNVNQPEKLIGKDKSRSIYWMTTHSRQPVKTEWKLSWEW